VHPHLTHASLGPPHSASQAVSRLVQPFLQLTTQSPIRYNMPPLPPCTCRVYGPCRCSRTRAVTANGPRCRRFMDGLYTTEAEAKAQTDAKAEAKVILTRPRPAIFVYNSGSTELLGQRDLLRSFETANYLIAPSHREICTTI